MPKKANLRRAQITAASVDSPARRHPGMNLIVLHSRRFDAKHGKRPPNERKLRATAEFLQHGLAWTPTTSTENRPRKTHETREVRDVLEDADFLLWYAAQSPADRAANPDAKKVARKRAGSLLATFLDAISAKDADFFRKIAGRLEAQGTPHAPARPIEVALYDLAAGRYLDFDRTYTTTELTKLLHDHDPALELSRTSLTRAAHAVGLRLRSRGRPAREMPKGI
jgi:hypothetical protein